MGRFLIFVLLIYAGYYVANQNGIISSGGTKSPGAESATPEIERKDVYALTDAQLAQVNQKLQSIDPRSFPFGASTYSMSVPGGEVVEFSVNKTKTGWCPIRREPLFQVSVNPSKPVVLK